MTARRAFTLFEVAVSLLIVVIAVLSLAALLPAVLRVHEDARFALYADAQVLQMIETFAAVQPLDVGVNLNLEAPQPWDTMAGRRAFAPDLELKISSGRGAIRPLPTVLAERIDSPDDQIARVLAAGGYVYYANPAGVTMHRMESPDDPRPPNEAIRLLITVAGHAQHNALSQIPWKGWPYYAAYPSPPMRKVQEGKAKMPAESDSFERHEDPDVAQLWDTDLAAADGSWDWDGDVHSGCDPYRDYAGIYGNWRLLKNGRGWLQAKGQMALALWYAWRKGVPEALLFGRASAADIDAAYRNGEWVRAMRFLAFAAVCMTKHYQLAPSPLRPGGADPDAPNSNIIYAQPDDTGLLAGIAIPGDDDPALVDGPPGRVLAAPLDLATLLAVLPPGPAPSPFSPAALVAPTGHPEPLPGHFFLTHAMIVNYHETALALAMRHSAERPYDFQVLRPLNRQLMMDHPLLEFDLVDSPTYPLLSGAIVGVASDTNIASSVKTTAADARQWRPLSVQPIVNPGTDSLGVPFDWDAIRGDGSHATLAQAFSPAERCREIVFWAVDWTAWEDWELAPSAPVDASRYFRARPDVHDASATFTGVFMIDVLGTKPGDATVRWS
jgi:hypothetical protein